MERFNLRLVSDDADRTAFLELPDRLGAPPRDDGPLRHLLSGRHPLSDDADIAHYLLLEGERPRGRMTLTQYPGWDTLCLGYFECIPDQAAADRLFAGAREEAARRGLKSITGPIDVSFWIRYRFKVTNFDRVFFGEPENLPYYPGLFEAGGFTPVARYVSLWYRPMPPGHELTKFAGRSEAMRRRGIRIVHPQRRDFARSLDDVHAMLMELYQGFPGFQPISREDFQAIYGSLKLIMDPRLIALAYDGETPAGFFIAFPDYGEGLLEGSTLNKLWHLLRLRRNPPGAVLAYAGVRPGYEGLGGALYYEVLRSVQERQLPAVAALIQEGRVTAGYEKELVEDTTEYRLYRMELLDP